MVLGVLLMGVLVAPAGFVGCSARQTAKTGHVGQLTALESEPMLPPSVEIVCLVEDRQHVLQVGTPCNGEWPTSPPGASDLTPVERVPVPRSEQPPKSDCQDLAVVVPSSATPRALTVHAFDGYLGGDGIPADEAFYERGSPALVQ